MDTGPGDSRPQVPGWDPEEWIGFGRASQVWSAVSVGGTERAAIKLLLHELPARDLDWFGEFRVQVTMLSTGPGLVQVRDAGLTPNQWPYLVMELMYGSLADRGPMTWARVEAHLRHVTDALTAIHRAGHVHGSVTPGNVLLTKAGEARLADACLAELGERLTVGRRAASPHQAPELAERGSYSIAGDVYALASTVHTLLTGRSPFPEGRAAGQSVPELIGPIASDPDLASRVHTVLARGLAFDPSERPASVAEFARELSRPPVRGMTLDDVPAPAVERLVSELRGPVPEPPLPPAEPPPEEWFGTDDAVESGPPAAQPAGHRRLGGLARGVAVAAVAAVVLGGLAFGAAAWPRDRSRAPAPASLSFPAVTVAPHAYPEGDQVEIAWTDVDHAAGVRTELLVDGHPAAGDCPAVLTAPGRCLLTTTFGTVHRISARASGPSRESATRDALVRTVDQPALAVAPGPRFHDGHQEFCRIAVDVRGLRPNSDYSLRISAGDARFAPVAFRTDHSGAFALRVNGYGYRNAGAWIQADVAGLHARRSPWDCD